MNVHSRTKKQLFDKIRQLEEQLHNGQSKTDGLAAHRFSTLVAHLPGGIIIETPDRKVMQANQKFCEMFAIDAPPEALAGTDCREAARQVKSLFADSDAFVSRIDDILAGGEPVHNEELLLTDGRVFERDYVPVVTAPGQVENLWHYRDITRQKAVQVELRESKNKYKESIVFFLYYYM